MLKITKNLPKILVILGPTASGKSSTAIKLAQKFNGEIISCDSRQIYRGMDIGSGKITQQEQSLVPHWMLDVVSPRTDFNVAKFKKKTDKIILDILRRGKLPILCGGTGFWIKAIVDNVNYPEVKPDPLLRSQLRNKTASELFAKLKELDPERAQTIDSQNPVRLIRAIEICQSIGRVPEIRTTPRYQTLQIGIQRSKEELSKRIRQNIEKRLRNGMIEEVQRLHKTRLSWKKIESFGLSYRLIPQYLHGKISSQTDLLEKIFLAEKDYAKRQLTWFQKDKSILWLDDSTTVERIIAEFLKK